MGAYDDFLANKSIVAPPSGFDPDARLMPLAIKPFQRDIVAWSCRRGRAAVFAGTGLGKTIQELSWLRQAIAHTGGQALLFAPLAVAEQIVQSEAPKFGFADEVAYAADEGSITSPITVTNYERMDKFDLSQFAAIGLDESGRIKAHDSRTRLELTEACRDTPYLLCASATPAPNDWTELGQHSEFLGVLSAKEMLATFFVHEGSVRANAEEDWRLKRHATDAFWKWVASWAVMIRHPRDLGYDEPGYDLPPLHIHQVTVDVETEPVDGMLFAMEARTLSERLAARRNSVDERVAAVAAMVAAEPDEQWLIWCGLNTEADALRKAIPGAVNVQGSDSVESKVKNLLGFTRGDPWVLVSKPSIAGHGMNYQHCRRMAFCGLNDSFEQLFQAVRRCWRFGQTEEVHAYMIASILEGAVVANLQAKERKYEAMADAMETHMKDLCATQVRGHGRDTTPYNPQVKMELPTWLAA
jgi:hypothetical protein